MARKITIEFLGRDSTSKTAKAVEQRFGKLGGRLDRVGQVAGKVLAGGLLTAGAAAVKLGDNASNLAETQSKVAQVFGKESAEALDKFAASAASTMGQSKQTALDGAATFGIIGKSAGLSGKDLTGFSTKMVGLAGDMASFNNASPEEVITAIGAGMRGESEPLRRFGVLLDDATLRAQALKLGLIKTTKDALTPQQKALAAQAAILAQTSDQQGDFARTSDGLANKQRILKANLENMGTALGTKVVPYLLKASNAAMAMANWVDKNKTTTVVFVGVLGTFAAGLYAVSVAMRVMTAVTAFQALMTKRAAAGQWALNAAMFANPIGLVVVAILALGAGLVLAYKKSATFRAIVQATGAAGKVALGWIVDKARAVGTWLAKLGPIASRAKDVGVKAFKLYLKPIQLVVDLVQKLVGWLSRIKFPKVPKAISKLAGAAGGVIGKIPGFASGTNFAPGGAAIVGERGPELVNLPRGSRVTPNHRLSSGGGGGKQVIQLVVDGKVLAQSLVKFQRDTGRPIFV